MKHQAERSHPEIKWSSSKLPFLFAIFSSMYVFLSDNYLASAFKYPTIVLYANVGKAVIFIILSAFLLDFIIRRDRKQIMDSQRQLQENERALYTLMNSLPDAIYLKDGKGRWVQANEAALQFFGMEGSSYRGKNDAELYKENITGDGLSICHVSDEYAWSTGRVFRHEESFKKEDGSVCTYDVIKTPIFDSKGNRQFLAVTARNITERKKIETELMKSKQRYQGLYNAISGGVVLQDSDGTVVHANEVACKIMGISEHQILGPSPLEMEWEFVNEDGSPLPWEEQSFMAALQTGKPVRNKVIGIQHSSLPARRWLLGNSEPIFDLNGEKPTQVVSTFVDITQLKQTEDCLRESEERYRLLVEHFPDMIATGYNGLCSYMNPGGARLLGSDDAAGFIGQDTLDYILEEDHKLILDMIDSVQNTGVIINPIEHKMVKINGDTVDVETIVIPIHYNGKPATMNVTREITERKRTEEALRKADTLSIAGKLAAGVAHEVRNPLTVLKGFLQLYKEKEKDEAAYLDIMLSEVDRIEFIITEFLMLAKPDLITFKRNSIQEIVQHTITLFETQAIMERVEIVSNFDQDLPLIKCEENQLKQVFINILKNALESMKEGGRILVEVEKRDESNVCVRFTDEGCGIPEEKLAKLGEPFYTTKEKGTGLGLMVSYNIIKNHKGKINVKSKMEKGTCFDVILPVVN